MIQDSCKWRDEKQTCYACHTGFDLVIPNANQLEDCIDASKLPPGFGLDPPNLAVSVCNDKDCLDCRSNIRVCKACRASFGLQNNACLAVSAIPDGYGLDKGIVRACSDPNCLQCRLDYRTCTRCTAESQTYILEGTCLRVNKGYGPASD